MMKHCPQHVAIIMDGNGRWAKRLKRPRTYGHQKGLKVIESIITVALKSHIKVLSLFAFSTENWSRPSQEVNFLMKLVMNKLTKKTLTYFHQCQIQFRWTGFKEHLSQPIIDKLWLMQSATANNNKIILNLCFNYGGRQDILQASQRVTAKNDFEKLLLTNDLPPVDLLIRTGNEKRISNFMLWQLAYAEIIFEPTFWPAYNPKIFAKNLLEFSKRQRRFGGI